MKRTTILLVFVLLLGLGCMGEVAHDPILKANHSQNLPGDDFFGADGVTPPVQSDLPFVRVGVEWISTDEAILEGRTSVVPGEWSSWKPIVPYWSEQITTAGNLEASDGSAYFFQLRLIQGSAPWRVTTQIVTQDENSSSFLQTDLVPQVNGNLLRGLAPESLVHPRSDWDDDIPACANVEQTISTIIIHHTDAPIPDGVDIKSRLRQIRDYHISANGACDIGYHFVIDQNGEIWQGRPENIIGQHTNGNSNYNSVGIAFNGTYNSQSINDAQRKSVVSLLVWLHNTYGISLDRTTVLAHRQVNATDCPGVALIPELDGIVNQAALFAEPSGGASPDKTGILWGTVVDGSDHNNPLNGAQVTVLPGNSLTVGADARFSFSLPYGTYQIRVSAQGYDNAEASCEVNALEETECVLKLYPRPGDGSQPQPVGCKILGNVLAQDTLEKVPQALVLLENGQNTRSDGSGGFVMTVGCGDHVLTASADGFAPASISCPVPEGQSVRCDAFVAYLPESSGSGSSSPGAGQEQIDLDDWLKRALDCSTTGSAAAGDAMVLLALFSGLALWRRRS